MAAVAGRERPGQGSTPARLRRFDAVWSVEPVVVGDASASAWNWPAPWLLAWYRPTSTSRRWRWTTPCVGCDSHIPDQPHRGLLGRVTPARSRSSRQLTILDPGHREFCRSPGARTGGRSRIGGGGAHERHEPEALLAVDPEPQVPVEHPLEGPIAAGPLVQRRVLAHRREPTAARSSPADELQPLQTRYCLTPLDRR